MRMADERNFQIVRKIVNSHTECLLFLEINRSNDNEYCVLKNYHFVSNHTISSLF